MYYVRPSYKSGVLLHSAQLFLNVTLTPWSVCIDVLQKTMETNNTENKNSQQASVSN
jgi:hypothetical protein